MLLWQSNFDGPMFFKICIFPYKIGGISIFTDLIVILHLVKHYFVEVVVTLMKSSLFSVYSAKKKKLESNMTKWQMLSQLFYISLEISYFADFFAS